MDKEKNMIEKIESNSMLIAIIIRSGFEKEGIEFFTPNEFSQQLAYMKRQAGYKIDAHVHNLVLRQILFTQEVLLIKSGKVKIDFYTQEHKYLESKTLYPGDVILLASGGHGIEFLEKGEIIEIKQGPYAGDKDKERFNTENK